MATTKTKTIAVRVPLHIAEALESDAADFKRTPGQHLRELLTSRYSASPVVRKSMSSGLPLNTAQFEAVND